MQLLGLNYVDQAIVTLTSHTHFTCKLEICLESYLCCIFLQVCLFAPEIDL